MNRRLQEIVATEYGAVATEIRPKVRAALADRPLMAEDYAVSLNAAQNVIRDCMAVTLNAAMPQPPEFFGELATRLACYVLTALAPGDQEPMAMMVRAALLDKLGDMQASGVGLKGEWER